MAEVQISQLSKTYPDGTRAVKGVSLTVPDGELCVLVGPSGCGKTTLLRMVAGLEEITGGEIRIDGTVVNDLPAKQRDIAMVFQNYALYPHMSVYDNMAFSLKLRKESKRAIDRRVRDAASVLGLAAYLDRQPRLLSGGQRQRVAMGRAIVREPRVMLMDEPLSNLDAKLRVQMRTEIGHRQRTLGLTTLYVTHDQTEAMTLGDVVAVFRQGVIEQAAPPAELFENPANIFVASFIGSPAMNLLDGRIERQGDRLAVALGPTRIALPAETVAAWPHLDSYAGRSIVVGVRPEDVVEVRPRSDDRACLVGRAAVKEVLGRVAHVHAVVDALPAVTDATLEVMADVEGVENVSDLGVVGPGAAEAAEFTAVIETHDAVREGEPIEIALDARKLYFFDPESGAGLRHL